MQEPAQNMATGCAGRTPDVPGELWAEFREEDRMSATAQCLLRRIDAGTRYSSSKKGQSFRALGTRHRETCVMEIQLTET